MSNLPIIRTSANQVANYASFEGVTELGKVEVAKGDASDKREWGVAFSVSLRESKLAAESQNKVLILPLPTLT